MDYSGDDFMTISWLKPHALTCCASFDLVQSAIVEDHESAHELQLSPPMYASNHACLISTDTGTTPSLSAATKKQEIFTNV